MPQGTARASRTDNLTRVEQESDAGPVIDADAAVDAGVAVEADGPRRGGRRPRRMWLQAGSSTARWGWEIVGWGVTALGAGVLAASTGPRLIGGPVGGWVGTAALWVLLMVPTVFAFARSVPRGLLRFRATDLLFGLVFGLALRVVAGWLEAAASGVASWPSLPTVDGRIPASVWFGEVVVPIVVSPVIEEVFFHGVLLVALYTAFRRMTRTAWVAGAGAALVSTGLFVLLHQFAGSLSSTWDGAVTIALVGLTGAVLVLVTGRLWGAVLTHIVFNATGVGLALVGTLLGGGAGLS